MPEEERAGERLARLDRRDAEEAAAAPPPEPPRRAGSRYSWVVGVAAVIVIVIVSLNSLPNTGRGIRGPSPGTRLPEFAAPLAERGEEADANVRQAEGGSAAEGAVPACDVRGPGVVNLCDLRSHPVVITFVTDGCEEQFDRVDAVRRRFPRVRFVGVVFGRSAEESAALARAGAWDFPVAADRDAAVFNLYRVGDCPSTVLAHAGGRVATTRLGPLDEPSLSHAVASLRGAGGAEP